MLIFSRRKFVKNIEYNESKKEEEDVLHMLKIKSDKINLII